VLLKQEFAFTPAGYGTEVAEGKEVREFNGKMHDGAGFWLILLL
jgi:hypothetical protein